MAERACERTARSAHKRLFITIAHHIRAPARKHPPLPSAAAAAAAATATATATAARTRLHSPDEKMSGSLRRQLSCHSGDNGDFSPKADELRITAPRQRAEYLPYAEWKATAAVSSGSCAAGCV
ncbi:hypothetical protein EYF80_032005 [Liparis tanakae]|uniref:Uncharacterized protein n=1 Tax=Liparis tanakae TaxID=230148 RepID=A0A4Z2GWZ1_9TELE|nr:hypothetical protein EYF80_032005 [Liparis tanakae]